MKRLALLLALCLLVSAGALAQEETLLPREELHAFVDQLFAAAAGTSLEAEQVARAELTPEACDARDAELAAYRAAVRPWLMEAFLPEDVQEETPAPEDEAALAEAEAARLALEDAFAALQDNDEGRACLLVLRSLGAADRESCLEMTRQLCRAWMAEVDHEALAAMNGDYACWLYAPGTQIDYPVVHGEDNSRYLSTLFNGEKNASGTLFIDYRNLADFADPNTLIYGHHMRNDSMFGQINDYQEQAFYAAHPYMLVMSGKEIAVIEVLAGYTTSSSDHCYDIAISDEEDMEAFVETARGKSDFTSGVEVSGSDRLVTLSTCAYAFENARYIVIGRLATVCSRADASLPWTR